MGAGTHRTGRRREERREERGERKEGRGKEEGLGDDAVAVSTGISSASVA
jgi:hypothetical protein